MLWGGPSSLSSGEVEALPPQVMDLESQVRNMSDFISDRVHTYVYVHM